MLKITAAMSLTVLAAFTVADARANLLTNGGFNLPVADPDTFVDYGPGSTGITGWTVVGPGGVSLVANDYMQGIIFPSDEGANWLDLTGDGYNEDTEGVTQTVTTIVGDQYTLSFAVGNVYDPGGLFGTTSTADVSANGVSLGAFENSCTACTTTQEWQPFSTTFVATSISTPIQFLNGDPSGDNTNGLDNVVLLDDGKAPVPEPSSLWLALLSVGLVGMAGFARRRTARQASRD
jgi:hypothetical protein